MFYKIPEVFGLDPNSEEFKAADGHYWDDQLMAQVFRKNWVRAICDHDYIKLFSTREEPIREILKRNLKDFIKRFNSGKSFSIIVEINRNEKTTRWATDNESLVIRSAAALRTAVNTKSLFDSGSVVGDVGEDTLAESSIPDSATSRSFKTLYQGYSGRIWRIWINPTDMSKQIVVVNRGDHVDYVIENPEYFGLTQEEIEDAKKNDKNAEWGWNPTIIGKAFDNGWIRISFNNLLNYPELSLNCKSNEIARLFLKQNLKTVLESFADNKSFKVYVSTNDSGHNNAEIFPGRTEQEYIKLDSPLKLREFVTNQTNENCSLEIKESDITEDVNRFDGTKDIYAVMFNFKTPMEKGLYNVKSNKFVYMPPEIHHTQFMLQDPKEFGIKVDRFVKKAKNQNADFSVHVIKQAYDNGWIRIAATKPPNILNIGGNTEDVKAFLKKYSKAFIDEYNSELNYKIYIDLGMYYSDSGKDDEYDVDDSLMIDNKQEFVKSIREL